GLKVGRGCVFHGVGWLQADALPFEAPLDHPGQYAGPFRLQPFQELLVTLGGRDCYRERNEMKSAADRFINRAKAGHVIAGDEQLEAWSIFEKISAHEPSHDLVAAGESLDL